MPDEKLSGTKQKLTDLWIWLPGLLFCERIRNTPVPRAYALFVKQTLFFYTLMFPFGWVDRFGFLIVPIMLMMVYILLGLEMLSEELEEPFSSDDTGLRLDVIANNIAKNVEKIACEAE